MKRLFPVFSLLVFWLVSAQAQTTQPGSAAADSAGAPSKPQTEMIPETAAPGADPILDPGPLPNRQLTLIGGVAKRVDMIRSRMLVQPFGGGQQTLIWFDDRSHIYRDGAAVTVAGIHRGDRVYVDTMELNSRVFARTIRVETSSGPADAHGQLLRLDSHRQMAEMRDTLTARLVTFSLSDHTHIHQKNEPAAAADLLPGTLLEVIFVPAHKGGLAQDINILAMPGRSYAFAGRITNINMRSGLLAVDNESDGKNYEIGFNGATVNREQLRIGAAIALTADFTGRGYTAHSISVTQPVNDTATE
jgi:hypothetical protein